MSACQSFRSVFFVTKYHFLVVKYHFLKMYKGVWPCRYAYDIPLVTLILNTYEFVGLSRIFFLIKVTF